jgi:hypothetical protein
VFKSEIASSQNKETIVCHAHIVIVFYLQGRANYKLAFCLVLSFDLYIFVCVLNHKLNILKTTKKQKVEQEILFL